MDYMDHIIDGRPFDKGKIQSILDDSLLESDFFSKKSRRLLTGMGLKKNDALMLLAHHKSKVKYGYDLSPGNLLHFLDLVEKHRSQPFLQNLTESPFFLIKACWLYEHAPFFLFYDQTGSQDLDELIIQFANKYDSLYLKNKIAIDSWSKVKDPRQVMAVTFFDNQYFDPVAIIEKARLLGISGLELSIDFHPFNYVKLLPEEIDLEKREQIKNACKKSGLKIDIHSPIVGPYFPSPDPKKGEQLFYNPLDCLDLMLETIELAKDIGAGSVVVHHVGTSDLKGIANLITKAGGSSVRVTLENYCQTSRVQNSAFFIECIDEISKLLPKEVKKNNFGITLDVGHLNIEGEDPLVSSEKIGKWCLDNAVYLRVHATDNYGKLLFSPPAYSADVHGNVTGRGINNPVIIKLLRSMGHQFDVIAEQIQPLSEEDIMLIHEAKTESLPGSYETLISKGRDRLAATDRESILFPNTLQEKTYLFLAGLEGIPALVEHMVYRKIQDHKYLSVDEAKKISQHFMKMPQTFKDDLIEYVDDLLLPIQSEQGLLQKSEIDSICHNISGAMFATINNEHLNRIFSQTRTYKKGDVICKQGTLGQEMCFIKEGGVTVSINSSPMASLMPGEIFGEISLFYNVARTATIKASVDKTKIGVLSRYGFEELLESSKPYAYDLIYRLYNILPERLRNLNDKYKTAMGALNLILEDKREIPGRDSLHFETRLGSDFFPTLTQKDAKSLFQEQRNFETDQPIFSEGDKADGAYYILEGNVKAVTFSKDHEEIILGKLGKDDIFGEMALIDDKPRSASIVTTTPCKVGFVDKKSFSEFTETRSDLAFRLMSFICLSLFKRILTLDKFYGDIKQKLDQ